MKKLNIVSIESGDIVNDIDTSQMQSDALIAKDSVILADETEKLENLNGAIEDAISDVEELEEIKDVVSETVADNKQGLSPDAAAITNIAVESIYAKLGIKNKKSLIALESFNNNGNREATVIAIEGIADTISKTWTAIKTAFSKTGEMIADLFRSVSQKALKVNNTAKEISVKINALKGKPSADTITNDRLALNFIDANGVVSFKAVETIMEVHITFIKGMKEGFQLYRDALKKLIATLTEHEDDDDRIDIFEILIGSLLKVNKGKNLSKLENIKKEEENIDKNRFNSVYTIGFGPFIGYKYLLIQHYVSKDAAADVDYIYTRLDSILDNVNKTQTTIPILATNQLKKLCEMVTELSQLLSELDKNTKDVNAFANEYVKNIYGELDIYLNKSNTEEAKVEKALMAEKDVISTSKIFKAMYGYAPSLSFTACELALLYINESIKMYESV